MAFDRGKGNEARRRGMRNAAQAADPVWWAYMLALVLEVAKRKPYLFTDDIERLRSERGGPTTHENRAIGPLMIAAKKNGWISPVDHWAQSSQVVNHRRHMRVWYSHLYTGPAVRKPRPRKVIDPRQFEMAA